MPTALIAEDEPMPSCALGSPGSMRSASRKCRNASSLDPRLRYAWARPLWNAALSGSALSAAWKLSIARCQSPLRNASVATSASGFGTGIAGVTP
jgi:hypothetical protein